MHIFALETDRSKILDRFCHEGECVIRMTYFHGMRFFLAILKEVGITAALLGIVATGAYFSWNMWWTSGIVGALWVGLAFFPMLKSYIDWYYDYIILTTDKVVLVDQTSLFKQEIKPIHIENIGSVATETQFLNLFNFGRIIINLKEGEGGQKIIKTYVPNAKEFAGLISDVVTKYQRGVGTPSDAATRPRTTAYQAPATPVQPQPAPTHS